MDPLLFDVPTTKSGLRFGARIAYAATVLMAVAGCTKSVEPPPVPVPLVSVSAARGAGRLPQYLYRAGIWVSMPYLHYQYLKDEFLAENVPGVVQMSGLVEHTVRRSACSGIGQDTCSDSFVARLADAHTDGMVAWLTDAQAKGGRPVLAIDSCPVPQWLSACESDMARDFPNIDARAACAKTNSSTNTGGEVNAAQCPLANRYVPRDLNLWTQMMTRVAQRLKNAGLNMAYITYHEPEADWGLRTDVHYFAFHKATVLGIKRADPSALIGTFGGTGGVEHPKVDTVTRAPLSTDPQACFPDGDPKCMTPMMYNFIKYSSQTAIPELGLARLPIDFVNWHAFNTLPDKTSWERPRQRVAAWLEAFGYSPDVPYYPGDWNLWDNVPKYLPGTLSQDTEVAASYMIATLAAFDAAQIAWHSADFDVDLWPTPKGTEFEGRWPVFTHGLVKKAAYNGLRLVSGFGATDRLSVEASDPFLSVVAGAKGSAQPSQTGISILMTNYVPHEPRMIRSRLMAWMRDRGYSLDELLSAGVTRAALEELFSGGRSVDDLSISDPALKATLVDALAFKDTIASRQVNKLDFDFAVSGLHQGRYKRTEFVVDAAHANAYAVRDSVDASVRELVQSARMAGLQAAKDELQRRGYTVDDLHTLEDVREECQGQPGLVACLFHWIQAHPNRFSHPDAEVVEDLKDGYRIFQAARTSAYSDGVDRINNRPEIDLRPSVEDEIDVGDDGALRLRMSLLPWASALIRLEPLP